MGQVYVRRPRMGAGEKTILPFIMKEYRDILAVNVFRGVPIRTDDEESGAPSAGGGAVDGVACEV
jgi:hypothetical protein